MALPEWLTISQNSGGTGQTVITITADPNTDINQIKTALLTISGNTKSVVLPVTSLTRTFTVTPSTFNLPKRAIDVYMTIETDAAWEISPNTLFNGDVSFSPTAGTGTTSVRIRALQNTSGSVRSGTTSVIGALTSAVTITQASSSTITVNPDEATAPISGGTVSTSVQSSTGYWEASFPSWVVVSPVSGTGTSSQTVRVTVPEHIDSATTGYNIVFYDAADHTYADRASFYVRQAAAIIVYYTTSNGQSITPPSGWSSGGYGVWYRELSDPTGWYGVNVSGNTNITSIESTGRVLLNCKNCTSLVYVDTPNGEANTNSAMFSGCTSLTGITCNTYTIMTSTFSGDYNLKRFVSTYNSASNPIYVEAAAFQGCTSLEYMEFWCPRDAQIYPGTHPFRDLPANGTLVRPSGYDYSAITNELTNWSVVDL